MVSIKEKDGKSPSEEKGVPLDQAVAAVMEATGGGLESLTLPVGFLTDESGKQHMAVIPDGPIRLTLKFSPMSSDGEKESK